jgi:hypothetical protein
VVILLALLITATVDEAARFAGTWRGDSMCVAKNTACRDESVVYRITGTSVSADKIVEGKPVNMGTLEFHYDAAKEALVCEYAQGVWQLKMHQGNIEGTLVRPDGTLLRRVSLHK